MTRNPRHRRHRGPITETRIRNGMAAYDALQEIRAAGSDATPYRKPRATTFEEGK